MEQPPQETEVVTIYGEASLWLEDGMYKLSELKERVAFLERVNAANVASMKEVPNG